MTGVSIIIGGLITDDCSMTTGGGVIVDLSIVMVVEGSIITSAQGSSKQPSVLLHPEDSISLSLKAEETMS